MQPHARAAQSCAQDLSSEIRDGHSDPVYISEALSELADEVLEAAGPLIPGPWMEHARAAPLAGSRFEQELSKAAADAPLDEALAALAKIAKAAGVWVATLEAQSITEVGDIIAAAVEDRT